MKSITKIRLGALASTAAILAFAALAFAGTYFLGPIFIATVTGTGLTVILYVVLYNIWEDAIGDADRNKRI